MEAAVPAPAPARVTVTGTAAASAPATSRVADGAEDGADPAEAGRTLVVWDESMCSYDFGPAHPLHPVRLELTMDLAARTGVLAAAGVDLRSAAMAGDDLIELVHDPAYVSAVRAAPGSTSARLAAMFGLGSGDNPVFDRMHEAAALVTGATIAAADGV